MTFNLFCFYLIIVNITAFAVYGADKSKAIRHDWRISERTLLLIALCGGAAGALLAMILFRHKIKKARFVLMVPAMLAMWILLVLWLVIA